MVDHLKTKMLMGMDILKPEKMNIDIDKKEVTIRNCNGLVIPIQITTKNNVDVKGIIRNDKKIIIPANSVTKIPINFRSTVPIPDKNYWFEPKHEKIYTHVVNLYIYFIFVKNDIAVPKTIPVHCHINILKKLEIDFCYTAYPNDHIYAISKIEIKISVVEKKQKIDLSNGVRVYGNDFEIIKIKTFVSEFEKNMGKHKRHCQFTQKKIG